MPGENDGTTKTGRRKPAPLTQAEFNGGLIRALESSLLESAALRDPQPRPGPLVGQVRVIADVFRALVESHRFATLGEVKAQLIKMHSDCGSANDEQLFAQRFLWRLRQNVASCPIYWRGRSRVGELGP
jgi:hypothetical protein